MKQPYTSNQENACGIIYCTTNLINGKKYIGQDSRNQPTYLGSGIGLLSAIKKYGRNNFQKDILQDDILDKQSLNEAEVYWIDYFGAVGSSLFYNAAIGGTGGYLGPEVSRLMSERRKKKLRSSCFKKGVGSKPYADRISKAKKGKDVLSLRKPIARLDHQGNVLQEYDGFVSAVKEGFIHSRILICCRNKKHMHGGFRWKYLIQ